MNERLTLNPMKRRSPSVLLGLALDGSRLEGALLKRTHDGLQLVRAFSVPLSLDPLTAAPELVGREIRNHLDAAGVRERRCIVGVPLRWALTVHADIPDLPDADVAGLLQLEAERGFPCPVGTLRLAVSRGGPRATTVGIPASHLERLELVLMRAGLKPAGFGLGIVALQPAGDPASDGVLALALGESDIDLQITADGGVAALRALRCARADEGGPPTFDAESVAREIRVTMGQLPAAVAATVRRVRVFGVREAAEPLASEIRARLRTLGLTVEWVAAYASGEFGFAVSATAPVSTAFSLAARHLAYQPTPLEFLAPKVTLWRRFSARPFAGRLRVAGAAAAAILLVVGGAFSVQQWQLSRLRAKWQAMAPVVAELEATQQQIQQYRPWYSESPANLGILRQLTVAFPEEGVVAAKTLEIRDGGAVTCSGVARDRAALLRTLNTLRASDDVIDVKVDQIRGESPMQFTFGFHWRPGGNHAN